ncbi:2Fe-2S iron-sulfur cluster-binding protein [Acuticoccus kandeliae]|uniref:2Fe-2S iron-sulfur cluster-binding protein n=1 Tax=Acuticoccus kandeliae TaxID=2073160 RepID=UPI00196AAC73
MTITVDGSPVEAREGDSLLAAMLTVAPDLRRLEFGGAPRAGFCLMGACHDCMVSTEDGARLRACTTLVRDGLMVRRTPASLHGHAPLAVPRPFAEDEA